MMSMVAEKSFFLLFSAGSVFLAVLCVVPCAYANAGIPVVTVQLPFMLSLLVPVIIIEAVLLKQVLALHWFPVTVISLRANLISTIIGCPIAWFLQLFSLLPISIFPVFHENEIMDGMNAYELLSLASFIPPFPEYEDKLFWLLPFGGLVGLLPAYFISVWLEYPFIRKQAHERKINPKRLMYRVNLFSYALLLGLWCLQLCFNLLQGDEVSLLS